MKRTSHKRFSYSQLKPKSFTSAFPFLFLPLIIIISPSWLRVMFTGECLIETCSRASNIFGLMFAESATGGLIDMNSSVHIHIAQRPVIIVVTVFHMLAQFSFWKVERRKSIRLDSPIFLAFIISQLSGVIRRDKESATGFFCSNSKRSHRARLTQKLDRSANRTEFILAISSLSPCHFIFNLTFWIFWLAGDSDRYVTALSQAEIIFFSWNNLITLFFDCSRMCSRSWIEPTKNEKQEKVAAHFVEHEYWSLHKTRCKITETISFSDILISFLQQRSFTTAIRRLTKLMRKLIKRYFNLMLEDIA